MIWHDLSEVWVIADLYVSRSLPDQNGAICENRPELFSGKGIFGKGGLHLSASVR